MRQFRNRVDAGQQLGRALQKYAGDDVIVYALPRGGVVLGVEVAAALNAPLDLVIPRKIGHPLQPEYAIAAVAESGALATNEYEIGQVSPMWLEGAIAAEKDEARRRRQRYLGGRAIKSAKGRTAILVDDGIATGLTMRAAIGDVRNMQPARIVVAVPVAPLDTVDALRRDVDDVVTVFTDSFYLGAVGAYYDDFPQVSDEEVVALLQSGRMATLDSRAP